MTTREVKPRQGRDGGATSGGGMGRRWVVALGLTLGVVGLIHGGRALMGAGAGEASAAGPVDYGEEEEDPLAHLPLPERTARHACTICHSFVEPTMLTRTNWAEQILPRMMTELGVAKPDYSSSPEGELIRARGIYPDKPRIPVEQWPLIEQYYLSQAPIEPLPQDPRPPIEVGLKLFKTEVPRFRNRPPLTTLVKISSQRRQVFVGDDRTQTITMLDADGEKVGALAVGNVPVDLVETDEGLYVTGIGSFLPSEYYRAEVQFWPRKGDGFGEKKVLASELPRATQARFADFNGDGRRDFALCMFGNRTGRFSWFENLGEERYREHVLANKAGAMVVEVRDFNGDTKPDLMVLMAQELEMLILMHNDGKGGFSGDTLFQRPPVWGHSNFEVADFDRDGRMDLVVVNGDNGEYESPTKKYHGIRIYLNRGAEGYQEASFFPLNGAYAAKACDFDQDGDLDVAAIAYFPDYVQSPRESFVFLENHGNLQFTASTFRECISGRWLVMDVGDLEGDGDLDIVLGSYTQGPKAVPKFLYDIWNQQGASLQILRNRLKDPGPVAAPPGTAPDSQ